MRRFVFCLALLVLAGTALAGDNRLGIYFDEDEWTENCHEFAPLDVFDTYFVFRNSTVDALGGFEFAWRLAPDPGAQVLVIALQLPPGAGELFDEYYNLIVGLGQPLIAADGPVVLARATLMAMAAFEADLQLGPTTPATIPGHAAFNDFYEPSNVQPMTFAGDVDDEGWTTPGVARLGDCTVADEATAWGGVKALFR